MRILLTLIGGLLLAFFISAILSQIGKKFPFLRKIFPFHLSTLGITVLAAGITTYFFKLDIINFLNPTLTTASLIGAGLGIIFYHLLYESFLISEKVEQEFIHKHDAQVERLLEIVPGALTWIALTSPIWLSFTLPFAVAYIILLADVYWLFNACKISVLVIVGYRKMEQAKKVNWLNKLTEDFPDDLEKCYHLIVLPTYNESLEVLQPAFAAVANSNYPKEKIFLAVGFEERMQQKDPEGIKHKIEVVEKLGQKIGGAFATVHPLGLPGEIPGPGTNRNWMINNAAKEFTKKGIKLEQVLVTTLDADFVIHPLFLAGVLHKYLSTPVEIRNKRSFTGAFLYNNNYWQAPAFSRLISSGTAYWQLSEMVGSDKYINFSSLSINLKSLLDIGLWIPDKVNDDSGFFWKAYFHFQGDYKVIPHYLPISADAVLDVNLWKTFQNQYLQLKRWAYGVEHMPYIVRQYFKNRDMDFWDKTDKLIFITWSYMKWGSLAFFVTFAGLVIPLINKNYHESVVAYNLPVISSWILTAAFVGLFSTIYAHEKTVPPRPKNWSIFQKFWSFIQWALIPLILVTIASIPAIDAQTRLMLGKYLEYRTTNKARITS